MSAPELHADDLLDREARGALSDEERARLEQHLEVCSVCRFERAVRSDFRAEFESLGGSRPEEAEPESAVLARPIGRPRRRIRVRLLALVAVLLLLAGVATAELSGGRLLAYVPWSTVSKHAATTGNVQAGVHPKRPARVAAAAASLVNGATAPPPSESAEVAPRVAPATTQGEVAVEPKPAATASPTAAASNLFEEAREAREKGSYAVAVERYERLLALFPTSPQALTAHAVLGRLLLDRGEPGAALRHFDAYLASAGTTLGEEAMLGRALAFGKLGQSVQEADAWHALLRAYPGSLHGARAKERLSVLPTP
jgi:TolA-binding protein